MIEILKTKHSSIKRLLSFLVMTVIAGGTKAQIVDIPFTQLTEREFYSVYTKAGQPLLTKSKAEYITHKPINGSLTHDISQKIDLDENACFFYWDHADKIENSIAFDTSSKIVTIDLKWIVTGNLMNIRNKKLGICFKKQEEGCKYVLKLQKIDTSSGEYIAYPVEFIDL